METPGCKAAQKSDPTFLGRVELTPKKRKSVYNEPQDRDNLKTNSNSSDLPQIPVAVAEQAQNIDLQNQPNNGFDQDPQKADPNTETPLGNDDHESSFNTSLDLNKESEKESSTPSSFTLRLASPPSQRPLVCKFCGKRFLTKYALGGHQNAHRREREIQKARKEVQEYHAKSFLYSLPGAAKHPFSEPYLGHRHLYHPHNGYAAREPQAMPVYSHLRMGPCQGPTGIVRTLEESVGSSSMKPLDTSFDYGWPSPFPTSLGHTRQYHYGAKKFNEFNHVAGSNLTASLQAKENEACLTQKQHMDSSSLNLSIKCTESPKMGLAPNWDECSTLEPSMKQNESTELDLNLKL